MPNPLETIVEALLSTQAIHRNDRPQLAVVRDYKEQERRNARVAAEEVVAALEKNYTLVPVGDLQVIEDKGNYLEMWSITPPDIDMGYRVIRDEWSESDDGRPVRVIHEIELLAVSTVPPEEAL